jgi:hypothetical protein
MGVLNDDDVFFAKGLVTVGVNDTSGFIPTMFD